MQDKVFKIDDEYGFLTEEALRKEYCENKLTDKQIAKKYNVGSKVTVWRRRKFFGIENFYSKKSNMNAKINREFLILLEDAKLYLSQGLTYVEIAKKMGCSRMVAYRRMKEMGLITSQKSAMKKLKWHEPISNLQEKFLLGCLLGDGSMNSMGGFQCSHSYKQLEYIKYKFKLLANLITPNSGLRHNTVKNHQNGKTYYSYYMRTMQNENMKKIYGEYYKNNVKIFPYNFLLNSDFDKYSLAIWYMDDGGIKGNIASLYTYSFGYEGNLNILKFLKNKFDIEAVLKKDNREERSEDCKHFISLSDNSDKFFSLIFPYVLPNFQYKLSEKYRNIV